MAKKMKLTISEIEFEFKKVQYRWEIVNNLSETFDTIEDALENYTARHKKISAQGFCDYINSKDVGYFAITKEAFEAAQN